MEKLKVINLAKSYDRDVPVLRDISFCVDDRDFFVILGPSGCGKTTLLNIIAGVEDINGGEIYIDGIRVNENKPQKRDVAMVFQNYALYPTMNVFDNIAFPLRNRHFKKKEIEGKVLSVAKLLHIEDILKKRTTQISGGQKQRVAIGRAIVREPKLFLFDEPLSNLDATLRSEMRQELLNLHSQLNSTFIYVTHDQTEALSLATKIMVLRDGVIQQIGTPQEIYDSPNNQFVAQFIGVPAMNLFHDVECKTHGENQYEFEFFGEIMIIDNKFEPRRESNKLYIVLGVRSEDFQISPHTNGSYIIKLKEYLGETYLYTCITNNNFDEAIRVKSKEDLVINSTVCLTVNKDKLHIFN